MCYLYQVPCNVCLVCCTLLTREYLFHGQSASSWSRECLCLLSLFFVVFWQFSITLVDFLFSFVPSRISTGTHPGRACMEAGALAVLHKPFKAHEVQDLIVREGIA